MEKGKDKWIKNKVKQEIFKKNAFRILLLKIDRDICNLIYNFI